MVSVVHQDGPVVAVVSVPALVVVFATEVATAMVVAVEDSVAQAEAEAASIATEAAAPAVDLVATVVIRVVIATAVVASEAAMAAVEAVAAADDSDQGLRLAPVVDTKCVAFKLIELLSLVLCGVVLPLEVKRHIQLSNRDAVTHARLYLFYWQRFYVF